MSAPEKGYRLDIELSFARPLAPHEARAALVPWGIDAELYGQPQVRGARLRGELDLESLRTLLSAALENGLLRAAEVGLRGYLRGAGGHTEWMPWRRNMVLQVGQAITLELEPGVRYVLER